MDIYGDGGRREFGLRGQRRGTESIVAEMVEGCTPERSFHRQSPRRLSLNELGQLAGGIRHNAVGIVIRRFTQRLQSYYRPT